MKIQKLSLAVLAAAGLLAFSIPALADDTNAPAPKQAGPPGAPPGARGGRGFSADAQLERLTTELTLTDDQKPKVKAVLDDQFKQMQDMRNDTSVSQEDRRAKMQTLRDAVTAKMKAILTEEQFKKYQTLSMGRGPGGRRPAGGATNAPPQ